MTSRKPPSQIDPSYVTLRHARSLQSMVPGTMHGRIANASPLPIRDPNDPAPLEPAEVVFSYHGPLTVSYSLPYVVPVLSRLIWVCGVLETPGSSNTVLTVQRAGADLISITLAGGVQSTILNLTIPIPLNVGDLLRASCTTPGTGANGATLQVGFNLAT